MLEEKLSAAGRSPQSGSRHGHDTRAESTCPVTDGSKWRLYVRTAVSYTRIRTCERFFISAPNAHFPIDPHTLLRFVHWLPRTVRYPILRATAWG